MFSGTTDLTGLSSASGGRCSSWAPVIAAPWACHQLECESLEISLLSPMCSIWIFFKRAIASDDLQFIIRGERLVSKQKSPKLGQGFGEIMIFCHSSATYRCVCVCVRVSAALWFAVLSPPPSPIPTPLLPLCWPEPMQLPWRALASSCLPNCPAIKLLYVYNRSTEWTPLGARKPRRRRPASLVMDHYAGFLLRSFCRGCN